MRRALCVPLLLILWLAGAGAQRAPVTIPFELPGRHIFVQVTVNKSRPLTFILDTGASAAIIRTDVAKELGLKSEGQVTARGAGPGAQSGFRVRGATWSFAGFAGFSQPIAMALPLPELSPASGRWVDGIIGGEFIRQFVVELDYEAKHFLLHQPGSFTYTGRGEVIPIEFVDVSQPTIAAKVTALGGTPVERRFLFDIGAGGALTLHSPFVREQKLLESNLKTIQSIGGAGAGGKTAGRLGRVQSLQIGSFALPQPITMFSQDEAGSFANAQLAGNIGAQIAMRFRLFLDYSRRRMILEPGASVAEPFDRAFSGVALRASGDNFRTFRVSEILDGSPATEAGLQVGDIVAAVDGVPAAELTLAAIHAMFEKPVRYSLTIRRGDQTLTLILTPARLI